MTHIVNDFTFDAPRTKKIISVLSALDISSKKVLILTANPDHSIVKSASNLPFISVLEANKPNTYQILHADILLIQRSAIEVLENSISAKKEEVDA